MTPSVESRTRAVEAEARRLGFDACAVAAVGPIDPEDRLGTWLGLGYHGDMAWMAATREIRQDIRLRLPSARSVIVVARNYYQDGPEQPPGTGKVARYAWGRDYHKTLRKPLKQLADFCGTLAPAVESVVSVDSSPVLERAWAERAGLGWIGKNSLVLRRDLGSWFVLGTVATSLELSPGSPMPDHCGSCRACMDACPTAAIVSPQVVDANRCISYQTIENKGEVPQDVQENMAGWVFGCDICQEVCPWNRFAPQTDETDFQARPGIPYPALDELAHQDEATFNQRFEGTPVRRAKHRGMQRNAALVLRHMDDSDPGPFGWA